MTKQQNKNQSDIQENKTTEKWRTWFALRQAMFWQGG